MQTPKTPLLAALLLVTACAGPRRDGDAPTVVTVGSLFPRGRIATLISTGRSWSMVLEGRDLVLTVEGVTARFHDAPRGERVDYRFEQVTGTWTFLFDGGEVHWRGDEVRVGDETHKLAPGADYDFSPSDWAELPSE
ncbi:MAG: hypothetical protein H6828_12580 [Planctomycetes bacterium]|nr:hypothetical protein [Planctomycetota bacterium]